MRPAVEAEEIFIEEALLSHSIDSTEYSVHNAPWKKQYEIWRHGNDLISGATSQHDFEVAIMQLQRAVEQRDTILEQLYRFREVPWSANNSSQYSVMASLGIIRPSLKDPLRELRNRIVHEVDDVGLDRKQCEYLSDTAWYYLKATDLLTRQCAAELVINCGEDDPHFTMLKFTFEPGSWIVKIEGNIPDRHLLAQKPPSFLSVKVTTSQFADYRGVRHFKFRGSVNGSDAVYRRIVQTFFEEAV
jgi:hypothetical protein